MSARELPDLLHDLRAFIRRYVWLSDVQATLVTLWVAMTHAIAAFDYVAYLHITSPLPECGKTRLLEVLEPLVAKAWFTARVTAAVLMRKVDREHPVLLLDESDTAFNSDEQYAESLRGLLNAGYYRKGVTSVCIGQGANIRDKDFSVFCPKSIAGIGRLPATVESRSIPIVMKRRLKDESVEKWRHRQGWAGGAALHQRLETVMAGHVDTLRQAEPTSPEGLSDRAEDVLEPLFAIADVAGGEWPETVRNAAVALMGRTRADREADQNLPLELLTDIRQIFENQAHADALATKVLLDGLLARDDRPWAAFGRNEKPLTAHRMSRLLKTFDIEPAGKIRDGEHTVRGYRRVAFQDAFLRYLGSKVAKRNNSNKTGAESPKTEAEHPGGVPLSKTAKTSDKHWDCSALPLSTPERKDEPSLTDFTPPMGVSREAWARHHAGNGKRALNEFRTGTSGGGDEFHASSGDGAGLAHGTRGGRPGEVQ